MENEGNSSAKYQQIGSTSKEESFSSSFSDSLPLSSRRTKSLSNIYFEHYTAADIRRIRERLLRTNSHLEARAFRQFSKRQKLTLASIALVDFMSFCSMSIMAPFFPKEASEKGLSDTLSGFVFSFYALIIFITSPIFGNILPKIGAKCLFLSGIFIAGVCNLLFGTLEYVTDYTTFTTLCITIRGFEALGASAFSTASYVFVVNSFPNNIGAVLGILETFVGLGMSIGPALGGLLYSLGGFGLPFFVLGIAMVAIVPLNIFLLPIIEDNSVSNRTTSLLTLIKVPDVVVTSLIVVIVSSTWSFLDPTLEPHLRQFKLSSKEIGLIFLLFSSLYGLSSPAWGWVADKLNNHWSMMVIGLFFNTLGLMLLGPTPFLKIESTLWMNLVALSVLGISVALALLPTFQSVLASAIKGGCSDSISTYSLVAGVWSCMYALGEVIGPFIGGFLLQHYGFPLSSSVMAAMTLFLGVFTFFYFSLKSCCNCQDETSDSGISESWSSPPPSSDELTESSPLLLTTNVDFNQQMYTEEKVQYYEHSRRCENDFGINDQQSVTDIRGTISITAGGACEV